MATLEAIGFTIATSACVFVPSLLLFGIAVRFRHYYIAPRCTARPPETIYNPHPSNPSQDRGNAMTGWYGWANSLSYDVLLRGVPGTGTRKKGLEGTMLRCTLDGIILLRYHAICFKVTVLGMFLCLCLILPMNWTAACFNEQKDDFEGELSPGCANYNLTNYERTTLANIPALDAANATDLTTIWGITFKSLLGRMYGIVACSWFMTIYACYLMRREWVEVLAMRRVYYLEEDVHGMRKEEIKETLLKEEEAEEQTAGISFTARKRRKRRAKSDQRREPWIPHPEQRETVPNIGLYSVLVGGLPSMPLQEVEEDDLEMAIGKTKKMSIDWQLALTTSFFDQCVPNQPGFSSSVAAVTIVPSASDIGRAWARWYGAAKSLRRLRYIRSLIAELKHYEIHDEEDRTLTTHQDLTSSVSTPGAVPTDDLLRNGKKSLSVSTDNGVPTDDLLATKKPARQVPRQSSIYSSNMSKDYLRKALGSSVDEDVETHFLMTFEFGPEQTAVYSREFAQSAAACCPYGMCDGRLRRARIDELLLLEQEAIADVHEANKALQEARERIERDSPSQLQSTQKKKRRSPEIHGKKLEADLAGTSSRHDAPLSDENSLGIDFTHVRRRKGKVVSEQWALVDSIVQEANADGSLRVSTRHANSGVWRCPTWNGFVGWLGRKQKEATKLAIAGTDLIVKELARDSTYAVVTFTSRQAAVAARQCLDDGRGAERWEASEDIPVPPLADAAPCALCPCRGMCRPVTMSLNGKQKFFRRNVSYVLLALIYIFYTIPITIAANLVDLSKLQNIFPKLADKTINKDFLDLWSGIVQGALYTLFFALCPVMFKSIANFGSNATTVVSAEYSALRYYWFFMLLTSFTGSSLATMFLQGLDEGIGKQLQNVLAKVAATVPTQISVTWINWMIIRTLVTIPLNYLLQFNTFFFAMLGWRCCSRLVRGGGPGGPTPYRVYVDSGVCFLCVVALAPASPLVSVPAFVHFLFFNPLIKRNLVYVYRPKFDSGGIRWPFLFDILISCILFGQVLLVTMVALKKALGPAILAAIPFIPTLLFRSSCRRQFLRSYNDAALVQTSMLDGWDVNEPTSMKIREEYRSFLVDAHKAAYVPVCIAGSSDVVTAEPAVVIPTDRDPTSLDLAFGSQTSRGGRPPLTKQKSQYGVIMSRITPRNNTSDRSSLARHFDFNSDGSLHFIDTPREEDEARAEGSLHFIDTPREEDEAKIEEAAPEI